MVAILRVILRATSLSHLASGDSISLVVANDSCSQCQGLIHWPIGEEELRKLCVQLEAVRTGTTGTRLEWKWEERRGWCSASTTLKNWCFAEHLPQKPWEKEDAKGSVSHGTGGHGAPLQSCIASNISNPEKIQSSAKYILWAVPWLWRKIHYVRSKHLLKPVPVCLDMTGRYFWCRNNLMEIKATWELTVWDENQILLQVHAGVWRRPGPDSPPVIKHPQLNSWQQLGGLRDWWSLKTLETSVPLLRITSRVVKETSTTLPQGISRIFSSRQTNTFSSSSAWLNTPGNSSHLPTQHYISLAFSL